MIFNRHKILKALNQIITGETRIMATLQDLDNKIAELKADIDRIVPPAAQDFQPQVDAVQAAKDALDAKFPA